MRRWSLPVLAVLVSAAAVSAADSPGGKIVYPRKEGEGFKLHVMNADGSGDHLLSGQSAAYNFFPTWSPDGKRIAYMGSDRPGEEQFHICLIRADGTGETTINANSQRAGLPAWSRDGKQIAFAAGDQKPAVYVADAEGNGMRQISPADGAGFGAFWMPDGKTLGYTRIGDGMKGKLVLAKLDGGAEETLVEGAAITLAGPNAISPDGKRLLFISAQEGGQKGSLRMWDFEAKADSLLTEFEFEGKNIQTVSLPAWAPDGKSCLLAMKTDKGVGLFKISEDGKTKTRLTPEGVDCLSGAWLQ